MNFITFVIVFVILLNHGFADFVLQSKEMATQKSKSNYWLTVHVFSYMSGMIITALMVGFLSNNWMYALMWWLINGMLHWITDYNTSRWAAKLREKEQHEASKVYFKFIHFPTFFSVIELDQLIHYFCLFGSFSIFV